MTTKQKILNLISRPEGATPRRLAWVTPRYSARIHELKQEGHTIIRYSRKPTLLDNSTHTYIRTGQGLKGLW